MQRYFHKTYRARIPVLQNNSMDIETAQFSKLLDLIKRKGNSAMQDGNRRNKELEFEFDIIRTQRIP